MTATEPDRRTRFEATIRGDVATVTARGELDILTAGPFRDLLVRTADGGSPNIVVDVSELIFCDSQGLEALLAGDVRAAAAGGALRLTGVNPRLVRILELTGLTDRLATAP